MTAIDWDAAVPAGWLVIRPAAIVTFLDLVTGRPPPQPPRLTLYRVNAAGAAGEREVRWTARSTAGGAVILSGFDRVEASSSSPAPPPPLPERYRLVVIADPVLQAEPASYAFTLPAPAQHPVRIDVQLMPGPCYPFVPSLPRIRGQVLAPGPDRTPVPAVVSVTEDGTGTLLIRAATDDRGRFTAGLVRYRTARPVSLQATSTAGVPGTIRPVTPADFQHSVDLTIP